MTIKVEITDEELKECVLEIVAKKVAQENSYGVGRFNRMYSEVIKEMLYEPKLKAELIEKATSKAAKEICRKGMPLLAEKILKEVGDA